MAEASQGEAKHSESVHDTLLELQEELARGDAASSEEVEQKERSLEEMFRELARQAGFEVEAMLGRGGMGAVLRAKDMRLKRQVALKFLPPKMIQNEKKIAELRGEAEIASRIKHENVVSILSWHEVDRVPFYAMELVEGESLADLVRRRGKLPVQEAMRIIVEATRGVEELHKNGIIHRDVKPQNILISRDGRVKITDFGISGTQDAISLQALSSKVVGTPQFMAPEQARGEAANKHSDIYGLAATLYFCLTARPPVKGAASVKEQLQITGEGKTIPITQFLPKLDKNVVQVIKKALHPQPARRAWDIGQFRKELEHAFLNTMRHEGKRWSMLRSRWLIGTACLVVGATAGWLGAFQYKAAQPPPPPPPPEIRVEQVIDKKAVLQASRHNVEILREIQQADSENLRVESLLADLNALQQSGDPLEFVARLDAICLEVERWMALRAAGVIANTPGSPLRPDALQLLRTVGTEEEPASLDQWRRAWLLFLQENGTPKGGFPAPPAPSAQPEDSVALGDQEAPETPALPPLE